MSENKPLAYQTQSGMLRIETEAFNQEWIESDTIKEVKR